MEIVSLRAFLRFAHIATVFLIFSGSAVFPQDPVPNNWLSGIIARFQSMRADAVNALARSERQIARCEATIAKSEGIAMSARNNGNDNAEHIARDAAARAQDAKAKNESNKTLSLSLRVRAEEALARLQNLLSIKDTGIQVEMLCHTGTVTHYVKRLGKEVSFNDQSAGTLEPGDKITTSAGSSARLEFKNGSHVILGENASMTIRESEGDFQAVELYAGSISSEVEKTILKTKAFLRRFEVRTPTAVTAVRGTRFTVSADSTKGTEVSVLEGTVEVYGRRENDSIPVEAGYQVRSSMNGPLSTPERFDTTSIDRWWER